MKKFIVISQNTNIKNFDTLNSADLCSIGMMVNKLDNMEGYILMTKKNIANNINITPLIPISFEEAIEIEFDMVLTSELSFNAFGGVPNPHYMELVNYCQKYENTPIFMYYLDRKNLIAPICRRASMRNLILKNPVVAVISYEIEHFIKNTKDNVSNVKDIIEVDLHTYSPFILKYYKDIFIDRNVENFNPDLIYGGVFRKDRKDFFDTYLSADNMDYKVEVYGSLNKKKYGLIKSKNIPQTKVVSKNSTAQAVILPPENGYGSGKVVQVRAYESFASQAVTFIHNQYDPDHMLLPNTPYRYFETYEEFVEKLNEIKNNKELRDILIEDQNKFIENFEPDLSLLKSTVEKVLSYGK